MEKAPTGIKGFDEIGDGGLPRGRPTLIAGSPGCGKTLFGMEFLEIPMKKKGRANAAEAFEKTLAGQKDKFYILRLYIAGSTPKSKKAVENVKRFCEEHLAEQCTLEIIDIYQQPVLAKGEQIIAAPTLVKKLPLPLRKLIDDLSDTEKILVGLDLKPRKSSQ